MFKKLSCLAGDSLISRPHASFMNRLCIQHFNVQDVRKIWHFIHLQHKKIYILLLLLFCVIIKDACGVYQGGVMCKYRESKDSKTLFGVKFNHSE
jgi:hypothetical protein